MDVITVRFDIFVNVRMDRLALAFAVAVALHASNGEMFAALPFKARPLDHVPEMRDHAHFREKLAVFIEIDPPRIAAPFGEHFKNAARGMITPDTRIHPLP